MELVSNFAFGVLLVIGIGFFVRNINKLRRNIKLGKSVEISGSSRQRWKNMAIIALGQSKMVTRPIAGILHIIVYIGFIVINIEVLEIVIDGLFGTHRIFSSIGPVYGVLIGTFEIFALLVFVAVVVFWIRRNIIRLQRFMSSEMKGWPKQDGNLILYFEIVLMALFIMDPRLYNGAIFVGLDSPVIKSHGATDYIGFSNSLSVCEKIIKGDLINKIKKNILNAN